MILLTRTHGCISLSPLNLKQAIQEEIENERKWKNAELKQCIVKFFRRVVNWLTENFTCLKRFLYTALLFAIMVQCK